MTLCAQVDLIVCWDSGGNPSRARQRMGRTGRSRPGHVVYLLNEGKELEKYEENLAKERQVKVCMSHMKLIVIRALRAE